MERSIETIEFHEAGPGGTPIRELGLTIAGTELEPILADFSAELIERGVRKVTPRFYLSTEWGVPFETVAIAIPFYLARPDLAELHVDRTHLIEGVDRDDILRYLRHEMGHVVNYAYRLYDRPDWVAAFGSITQPYEDAYRPEPWSPRFVRHLPGWYAQKHPDEDWAETFAVWLTPGADWRGAYARWPGALAKLELCDRIMAEVGDQDPVVTDDELDEDVSEIEYSAIDYYDELEGEEERDPFPPGIDGGLSSIFTVGGGTPASALIRKVSRTLSRSIFTWTGHFPEHTRALLLHLGERADQLRLSYREDDEAATSIALSTFVTSLAMNHVYRGSYLPHAPD